VDTGSREENAIKQGYRVIEMNVIHRNTLTQKAAAVASRRQVA
jgi:hypothetical protein